MKLLKLITPFLALLVVASFAQSVGGIEANSFGILPANPDPNVPLTKSWFLYEVDPGDIIEDGVQINNGYAETTTFKLEAVDAITLNGGGFGLLDSVSSENENLGSWVKLEADLITLEPGESKVINFVVTVPLTAEVGDHIGGLTVMAIDADPDGVLRSGGSTIRIRTRVGVRMYLLVAGDIIRDFKLRGRSFMGRFSDIVFKFKIQNLGNIRTEPKADIRIYGLFGLFDKADAINIGQIFPKETVTKEVVWEGKERPLFGPYFAWIKVYDAYEPMTRPDIESTVPPAPKAITTWAFTFFIPYTQTAVVFILLFLAWFIRQFFIWRRMVTLTRLPVVVYKVKKGDNLVDIADDYGVGWKLLAKINDIKAPYSLRKIKELHIPDARGTKRSIPVVGFWKYITKPFIGLWAKVRNLRDVRKPQEYAIITDKGDKRKDIESFTGMTWAKIAKYNGLKKTFKLKANVELRIPGKKPKQ